MKQVLGSFRRILAASITTITLGTAPTLATPWCTGDCNADHKIEVWEIVRGVAIAMDGSEAADCTAADRDLSDSVTIDELTTSVNHALRGCPGDTTALATAIAADFSSGGYAAADIDTRTPLFAADNERTATTDSVPRTTAGIVLIINRFGGNSITARDPRTDYSILWECSTGPGSNPQDVVVIDANKAYATLYGSAGLLVFDPSPAADCSDFVVDRIDLSGLADEDGIPEMTQMALHDGILHVALQKLTNFSPSGPGAIARIDTENDALIDERPLEGSNPFGATKGLIIVDGTLYVPQVGSFGAEDGGLEAIDLRSDSTDGFVIDEATLGGDLNDVAIYSATVGYATVGLPDFTSTVVSFDPSTGELGSTVIDAGASVSDIEINDRGELWVADRGANPGLRVFDAATGEELTDSTVTTGLPPFEVVFLH